MSFILDALKRADQERQQDGVPSIAIPQAATPGETRTDRRALTWLLWLGVALAAVALAVWISVTLATRLSIQAVSESALRTAPAADTIAAPRSTATEPVPHGGISSEPVTHKPLPQTDALTTDSPALTEISSLYQPSQPAPDETSMAVQNLYVREPAAAPRQPAKAQSPLPSPRAQEILAAHVPQIHELPRALQQSIPSIHYRDHRYHNGPDSRVVLNGQELRVGAQLGQDLRVDDILDDGVVLNFKGQSFKLRARNSWINM